MASAQDVLNAVNGANGRLDEVNNRLGGVHTRLDGTNARLDDVKAKLDQVTKSIQDVNTTLNWGFAQLITIGNYTNQALAQNAAQNDTMICILEHISRNTCELLNESHTQTGLQTTIRNSTTVQHGKDMNLMIGVFRNWGRTFVKWPVAADENQGPHLGGCATCTGLITVHTHTKDTQGQVEYRIEYYTMGHYTKFVPVGASRIDSTASDNVLNAAFKNPDSSLVLIAYNNTNEAQPFKVRWHSRVFRYTLPVNTSATFRWPGAHDNAAISGYGIQ